MFLLYYLAWIIFNGAITFEICLIGVLVAGAVFAFTCKFLDYSLNKEKALYRKIGRIVVYGLSLIWEIIKANLNVIKWILSPKKPEPRLVTFEGECKTETGRAFYANAITLTPGTITVRLEDGTYVVHALDKSMADGIESAGLQTQLTKLEMTPDDGEKGESK